jgi:hypothetical protein
MAHIQKLDPKYISIPTQSFLLFQLSYKPQSSPNFFFSGQSTVGAPELALKNNSLEYNRTLNYFLYLFIDGSKTIKLLLSFANYAYYNHTNPELFIQL